jgi:hypothetical protein
MQLAHVTLSSGRVLARTEAERRVFVRALVRACGAALIVFNLVDDHLHLVVRCEWPARLGEAVRRVLAALRRDLELTRPHVKLIGSQDYLKNAVRYVLSQTEHHQLTGTCASLWTGSAFLDLVGARLLEGFDPTALRQELPRLRGRDLYEAVGLAPMELVPADDAALVRAGAAGLVELAAAVFAVGPELSDRSDLTVKARVLAARLARELKVATEHVAHFLGVAPRSARRLSRQPVEQRAFEALRRRLALEARARR